MSTSPPRAGPLPILLRFLSCGILGVALGAAWRFLVAPARVGVGSAFAGLFFLLLGFILGGLAWYARDARTRTRHPERISDERLAFSFVVFAVVPFAVLLFVGLIWLLAFAIGAS